MTTNRQESPLEARLLRRVEAVLRETGLAPGGKLVMGVSGGPDSLALAHVLWRLRDPLRLTLYGAHLDHGIRGVEGAADAAFVQQALRSMGIPTFVRHVRLREGQPAGRLPSEVTARRARHRFFAELTQELHIDAVALGHTADDQAETVLLHLVRGTGTTGLAAMQPLSTLQMDDIKFRLLRPFLGVARIETHAYCALLQLHPRQDSTNLSLAPLRNRLRLHLLPILEEYNPSIKEALLRLARSSAREVAYLDQQVQEAWPSVVHEGGEGVSLDQEAFARLAPALQSHLLRLAYGRLRGGTPLELEQAHVEEMLRQMAGSSRRSAHLPGGITFLVEGSRALLTRQPPRPAGPPLLEETYALTVPGATPLPGWTVVAEVVTLEAPPEVGQESPYAATVDLDAIGPRLWVRARLQGDRFQPLGMEEEKRLQDFLVDAKVPSRERAQVPLVLGEQGIVWVVGHRIAHWARLTPETRRVLRVTFEPQAGG